MSDHEFTFEVVVRVTGWPDEQVAGTDWPDRTPEDYAKAALSTAGLSTARMLDGYADLDNGEADITYVGEL